MTCVFLGSSMVTCEQLYSPVVAPDTALVIALLAIVLFLLISSSKSPSLFWVGFLKNKNKNV